MRNGIIRELERFWDFSSHNVFWIVPFLILTKLSCTPCVRLHPFLYHKFILPKISLTRLNEPLCSVFRLFFRSCSFSFANTLLTCNPLSCNLETISNLRFFVWQLLTNHDACGNVWFFIFQIASKLTFSEWLFSLTLKVNPHASLSIFQNNRMETKCLHSCDKSLSNWTCLKWTSIRLKCSYFCLWMCTISILSPLTFRWWKSFIDWTLLIE